MYDIITEDYLVADETLLLVRKPAEHVVIPREIAPGHPITRIGAGAFNGFSNVKTVEIPDGVTYVGKMNSFTGSASITVPTSVTEWNTRIKNCSLTMTEGEYSRLLSKSTYVSSGRCLILDADVFPIIPQLIKSSAYAPPFRLPDGIPALFLDDQNPSVRCSRNPFSNQDCLRFDGIDEPLSEDAAFRLMLRRGTFQPEDPNVEQFDDHCISVDRIPSYQRGTLVLFSPKQVEIRESGRRVVPLIIRSGFAYWQSAVRVCCGRKPYYIYRRNYLTSNAELPYRRLDMAVYDENGLVTNRALSEKIYAKYKLSSLF